MKKMKMGSLLLSLLLVLSLFTACSSSPETSDQPQSDNSPTSASQPESDTDSSDTTDDEPYELSVAWWGGEARHEKTLEMIDLYMENNPQVTVVTQYAAYTDYWTKLSTQAAAGNMPDAYLVQLTYLAEYASKGLMHPLQGLVDSGKIDVSDFTSGALSSSSYNGELMGITFGDTASCIVYNKTLLDQVGYEMPKDQMLYSEFSEYLEGLVPLLPEGTYAMELIRGEQAFENYMRQLGCYGLTTEDGKSVGYTKEMLTSMFTVLDNMYKAGINGPLEVILDDRDKQFGDSLRGNGKQVFWNTNCNQAKIFQASVEGELGIIRSPLADNYTNQYVEAAVPSTWAIYGKSEKVDQAAHFINFMVNDGDAQEIYDMDIGVPGSTVIQQNLIDNLDLTNKVDEVKKQEIELMQDILNTIEPFNGRPAGYPIVVDDLYKKLDEILTESMTIEQAVDAHFAAMQTMLA